MAAATTATAGPEHDRLTAMCGTWDVEMTFWLQPGRPGITTRGTSTIRPLLNGLFVEETIEGTLTSVEFSNPHVIMHFTGAAEGEARAEWTMEMDPPTLLVRYGLKHDTFAAGMAVKITGVRARTGVPVMRALTIETQDGTVYRVSSRL